MQPTSDAVRQGCHIEIDGTVQGVGFRPWVYRVARELGLTGRVRNHSQGVSIDAFGDVAALRRFSEVLRAPPPPADVQSLSSRPIPAEALDAFSIVESADGGERRISIPADLATCPRCVQEIFDPDDRRADYPFTNCTGCGPRFTIAEDVPYDRSATTMRTFQLCDDCAREYRDPEDRRFHAEPNACPRCGPRLRLTDSSGRAMTGEPLMEAARALRAGCIVAVKGVGGFHLACDATRDSVVRRLRQRKRREEKPFAVMVRDLEDARRLAEISAQEARLLCSPRAPIVLVRRRRDSVLAAEVAPRNPLVGLLLAYSPLHHLLLARTRLPLVMTSGNLSDEPIAYRDAEAIERLGCIADFFLLHDREIATRCDDSVARVVADKPLLIRRSRGYVPSPIRLARPVRRPVIACGGQLKNTFCLAVDDMAVLGPHVGDLDGAGALESLDQAITRMERFLGVEPRIAAHDLHPDYGSTRYALDRGEPHKIGVQHHHAHVASALAEHGISGPVLGVAYDGTGYGLDGTAWGGELLLADMVRFERIATLRPIPLAGGEQAIREVWRLALALLDDVFGGAPPLGALPLFSTIGGEQVARVRQIVARRINSPLAHGIGRLFDAVGALVLGRTNSRFEGQIALEWNVAAEPDEHSRYRFAIDRERTPWELDLRPMVREIVGDLLAGRPAGEISAAFHNTLAVATAALVHTAATRHGHLPVVLTGGCFQNDRLAEQVQAELSGRFDVLLHGEVPPGDGGLALGQAVVADAVSRPG